MLLNADYVSTQISVILGLNIHLKEGDKSGVIQNCDYSKQYRTFCAITQTAHIIHMKPSNKMLKYKNMTKNKRNVCKCCIKSYMLNSHACNACLSTKQK